MTYFFAPSQTGGRSYLAPSAPPASVGDATAPGCILTGASTISGGLATGGAGGSGVLNATAAGAVLSSMGSIIAGRAFAFDNLPAGDQRTFMVPRG